MSQPSSPFKSYDIRGLVGEEITPAFASRLALALCDVWEPTMVLIGFDMRESSPALVHGLEGVFLAKGIDCINIGLCTTPVFNSAVAQNEAVDLGIMVTASHNPSSYNGFKLCRKGAIPIGAGSGMEAIRDLFLNKEQEYSSLVNNVATSSTEVVGSKQQKEDAVATYLDRVITALPDQGASLKATEPGSLKIVADAGNGMAGLTLPILARKLPALSVTPLYWELDGTFPNHEANPLKVETLNVLRQRVVAEKAMLGFAFDGDGDRVGVVDEQGWIVPGDALTALLARELLQQTPNAKILYDLRCSWSTPEAIQLAGGRPELCRVGHAHIKQQMRSSGALFAGELSMHFYFASFANCEASEYAMLLLIQLLQRTGRPLSELWQPLICYAHSGEKNYRLSETSDQVLTRLQERYASQATKATLIDGLRYEFCDPAKPDQDWWFSVRASNTEPVLRLNVEARERSRMEEKQLELEYAIIGANGSAPSTHSPDLPSS